MGRGQRRSSGFRLGGETTQLLKLFGSFSANIRGKNRVIFGGHPTLVDVSQNFWPLVDVFFVQKWVFLEIIEIYLPISPEKSLFIAFLLTNFPKISKKVLKNFSRRLRRRKCVEISPFFDPRSVDGPPLEGSPPPKYLWYLPQNPATDHPPP